MPTQVGIGNSTHRNPEQAGREAAAAALAQAGISTCDFVLMFATAPYDQKALLAAVREGTGRAPLVGCSGEGVIAGSTAQEVSHAVSVMVWKSDALRFRCASARGLKDGSFEAGAALARELGETEDARVLFLFPDGLSLSFPALSAGFAGALPAGRRIPLVGGSAGDAMVYQRTFQYHDDEVFSDGVSCALLHGQGDVAIDISHGCQPIGSEHVVTRAAGKLMTEIEGRPALDALLGEMGMTDSDLSLPALRVLALGIRPTGGDEYVVRGALPRPDNRSIFMLTEVTQGTQVYLMRRDAEKMLTGVAAMTERLQQSIAGKTPAAVVQIECLGRGKNMFREEDKQALLASMQSGLGKSIPWIGFYSFGEIAPVGSDDQFHNMTSVVAVIYES